MPPKFLGANNSMVSEPVGTVRILPVPYDATTSYKPGTRFGPSAIIDASSQLEYYNDDIGWDATQSLHFFIEDAIEPNVSSPEHMVEKIERVACRLLEHGDFILALGGEHSISLPLISAYNRKYDNLHVVQIDAHADLRNSWNDSSYSHACVMRRVSELGIKITQIGIRNVSQEGHEFLSSACMNSIRTWYADDLRQKDSFDNLLTYLREHEKSPIYLTIDVDGLDPSVIPATGTPEPGGLTWHDAIRIVKTICLNHTVVGADIVELAPTSDLFYADFAAAKLSYKIISYVYYHKMNS